MLDQVTVLFEQHKDREAFFAIVARYYPRTSYEFRLIEKAYDTAKNAFRHKYRDDAETRYFEHLRCVTLILMRYMRCFDYELIIAALLHDIIEDIPGWDELRVASEFTERVAAIVWWVTKPDVTDFDGDKELRNRAYHSRLLRAPRDALIIKLADRLHNLLTLWTVEPEKQRRKIRETQDFYLPLAEKEMLLVRELEAAIDAVLAQQ